MTQTPTPLAAVRTDRMRDPICPPWCTGHASSFQTWEKHGEDDHPRRDHESELISVPTVDPRGHVQVSVDAVEFRGSDDIAHVRVSLYVGNEMVELVPGQASLLAAHLAKLTAQAQEFIR